MLTIISSVLGIVATILAWNLNPRRRLYAELDDIYKKLNALYKRRDDALASNDNDALAIVTSEFLLLASRKNDLLKRLG